MMVAGTRQRKIGTWGGMFWSNSCRNFASRAPDRFWQDVAGSFQCMVRGGIRFRWLNQRGTEGDSRRWLTLTKTCFSDVPIKSWRAAFTSGSRAYESVRLPHLAPLGP